MIIQFKNIIKYSISFFRKMQINAAQVVIMNQETGREEEQGENERFQKIKKIGEGTFAVVYEGLDTLTNKRVAIKKIKMDARNPGLDIGALRELKVLRALSHPNIATMHGVYARGKNLNIVLEYYESDMERIIKDRSITFGPSDIKAWMLMILRGVECMHQRGLLHRDLKPSNLLVGSDGVIRLGDFGLCREGCLPMRPMTSQVVTLWYRAPELLLGAKYYGGGVDVWAVGCIFAELMLRTPFLACEGGELAQLNTIYRALGSPSKDWPEMFDLPGYHAPPPPQPSSLKSLFHAASEDALDLLQGMFTFNPGKRMTARECLEHPYFTNHPRPTPMEDLYHPPEQGVKRLRTNLPEGLRPRKLFTE